MRIFISRRLTSSNIYTNKHTHTRNPSNPSNYLYMINEILLISNYTCIKVFGNALSKETMFPLKLTLQL